MLNRRQSRLTPAGCRAGERADPQANLILRRALRRAVRDQDIDGPDADLGGGRRCPRGLNAKATRPAFAIGSTDRADTAIAQGARAVGAAIAALAGRTARTGASAAVDTRLVAIPDAVRAGRGGAQSTATCAAVAWRAIGPRHAAARAAAPAPPLGAAAETPLANLALATWKWTSGGGGRLRVLTGGSQPETRQQPTRQTSKHLAAR
jgi:hypothetical protein